MTGVQTCALPICSAQFGIATFGGGSNNFIELTDVMQESIHIFDNVDIHVFQTACGNTVCRICRYCGQSYSASVAERILLGAPADSAPLMLRRGVGCALCRGTGYRDRVAAFQVLDVTDELRELIAERASKQRIAEVAAAGGVRAIADEALELARLGQTSVEEAMRLVGVDG